ncbi:hypothetical protein RHO15_08095 [Utexia brackfieldae]|uniref:penicillin-binding protein activator LpoB n=1 Tax=Utexia brackfieldae TaxID=3074108 RepID=UPI00370D452E
MKKSLFYIFIGVAALLLNGCQLWNMTSSQRQSQSVDYPDNHSGSMIEARPQITSVTDWNGVFAPLIKQLLLVPLPVASNTLLVSDIKNSTDQYIPYQKINAAIVGQLTVQGRYKLIDKTTVNLGKQALGLPSDDTLVSRSKMIALGRYLGSDFVLFSSLNQIDQSSDAQPKVNLELLSTKTGEIIWRITNDKSSDDPQS